jgi:hypothetical protein
MTIDGRPTCIAVLGGGFGGVTPRASSSGAWRGSSTGAAWS